MIFITAADQRFILYLRQFIARCDKLGYSYYIYDLGDLGFGCPFGVDNPTFKKNGYYKIMNETTGWCSRGLHKPAIILDALTKFNSTLAYLDADAFPLSRLDEVTDGDYDIGVTVREKTESASILGRINAGILFVKPSAKKMLEEWRELTVQMGNDQLALNKIVDSQKYVVKEFPTRIYNYYDFPEIPGPEVKIVHFKSDKTVRPHFLNYTKLF